MILAICHQPDHASLPPSQIVPRLMDEQGWYIASESSFYRVLREHNEHHRRDRGATSKPKGPPRRHKAQAPNQVWSWDVTYLKTSVRGLFYYLYFIIDVYSRKIVGAEVFEAENAANSQVVLERALLREGCGLTPPVLHADNGSAMKGGTLQATYERLGITASFSRPRVSNDNAFSESLFGTTKQRPDYPSNGFESLGEARDWVLGFVHWYNYEHRHSGIRFVTPADRHVGKDVTILTQRADILHQAKRETPRRWSGNIRNCKPVGSVWLNPEPEVREIVKEPMSATT